MPELLIVYTTNQVFLIPGMCVPVNHTLPAATPVNVFVPLAKQDYGVRFCGSGCAGPAWDRYLVLGWQQDIWSSRSHAVVLGLEPQMCGRFDGGDVAG